jgi:phospholipase C
VHTNWLRDFDTTSLPDLLEASRRTWKVYAENLPSPCFLGSRSPDGLYVRRHQPLISMRGIQIKPARCRRIVNASELAADLASGDLADYSLYIPNLVHDGHDRGIEVADGWLQAFLAPLLADDRFIRRTLVVVTFDENSSGGDNRIYTVLVGSMVVAGVADGTRYDHYSLLRSIEDNFQVGTLGREDSRARSICCVWRNAPDGRQ